METMDYLKLKKKEGKTETELELLKAVRLIREIGEYVTDASKGEIENKQAVSSIRILINDWH